MYKGSITFETPMLYAMGFIGLFTIGGLTGVFLASLGMDIHLTETYFIVAHFHYIMVGGMLMAFLGGLHFWWPKITGRMYPETFSKLSAVTIFIGFNLTFFPQFILGYLGMPRRYHIYPPEFQTLNVLSTAGATILGVGYFMPVLYLLDSAKFDPTVRQPIPPYPSRNLNHGIDAGFSSGWGPDGERRKIPARRSGVQMR
jgi:cytochrome c oxidase subunit 1